MKRYMLFAGYSYYPCGGMNDFIMDYEKEEEAVKSAKEFKCDWWHILDIETRKETWKYHYQDKENMGIE